MIRFKISLLFAAIFLSSTFPSFAQNDVEEVRKFVREFNDVTIVIRTKGHEASKMAPKFFSSTVSIEAAVINIKNVITFDEYNAEELSRLLSQMRPTNLDLKKEIVNLNDVYRRDNLAYARYSVIYEWKDGDRLISKGIQFVDMIIKKYPNHGWRIDYYGFLDVDSASFKGSCLTEIFQSSNKRDFLTETLVPDGTNMDMIDDKFIFDTNIEPRMVRWGYRDYNWAKAGQVYRRNRDGSNGEQIGTAKTEEDAIKVLLLKEVYPDRCFSVGKKVSAAR